MENKYKYYKVLQQDFGYGWDDIGFYETDSNYSFRTNEEKMIFRNDAKAYRTNQPNAGLRAISRKELSKTV